MEIKINKYESFEREICRFDRNSPPVAVTELVRDYVWEKIISMSI